MQLSYVGLKALKGYEGFKAHAYKDTGGVWTIGYGTTRIDGRPVVDGDICTEPQASLWLQQDLAWAQTAVNQMVHIALSQNQYDALVSFVYNEGQTQFASSTLLKKLNAGDFIGAGREFNRWVFDNGKIIHGLEVRRSLEREMFEGPGANSQI